MSSEYVNNFKQYYDVNKDDVRKISKLKTVFKFMEEKEKQPTLKKKELCASIGISDSYLKRIMKDLDIKSFYRHDIPTNKKKKTIEPSKNTRGRKKKDNNSDSSKAGYNNHDDANDYSDSSKDGYNNHENDYDKVFDEIK